MAGYRVIYTCVALMIAWSSNEFAAAVSVKTTKVDSDSTNNNQGPENNIAFDEPDIETEVETASGHYTLQAYKSTKNDQILRQLKLTPGSQLTESLSWYSDGRPRFLKSLRSVLRNTSEEKYFHFTSRRPLRCYTFIEMLTVPQKRLLAGKATANYRLYGVNFTEGDINNLPLSRFECSLILVDEADNKHLLKGEVTNFKEFPLKMYFDVPRGSVERNLFLEQLGTSEDDADLLFKCAMSSIGKVELTNTLTIKADQLEEIGLVEKLFGESSSLQEVYVTRDQMMTLSAEMYSTLNIIEDYQMPEQQFSDAFVDGLIRQVHGAITMVPVDTVLAKLSAYGLDISGDLKADEVKRDIGKVLKTEVYGNRSLIVLDEASRRNTAESSSLDVEGSVNLALPFFWLKASAEWAQKNSKSEAVDTNSLNDQLRELNTHSQNDVEWMIEGERVIPKNLKVVRISRVAISKKLVFTRIKIKTVKAAFNREFSLSLGRERAPAFASAFDQLTNRTEQLEKKLNQAIKRCRICFKNTYVYPSDVHNGCRILFDGNRCSEWSDTPDWSSGYPDFNFNVCAYFYHWMVECQN